MVGTKSPNSADATYMRKVRKPMVEKRRRDRMNHSLSQLKSLLAVSIKQNGSTAMARLDKADILELTVSQLTTLRNQQRSVTLATQADGYKKGFKDCARETINYLSSTQSLDTNSLYQLNNHLHRNYLEKTNSTSNISYQSKDCISYGSAKSDIQSVEDSIPSSSYVINQPFQMSSSMPTSGGEAYGHGQYGSYCYDYLNDSVNTSLNSTCNMSLDSSSNITPEKAVPVSSQDDDVWRPW